MKKLNRLNFWFRMIPLAYDRVLGACSTLLLVDTNSPGLAFAWRLCCYSNHATGHSVPLLMSDLFQPLLQKLKCHTEVLFCKKRFSGGWRLNRTIARSAPLWDGSRILSGMQQTRSKGCQPLSWTSHDLNRWCKTDYRRAMASIQACGCVVNSVLCLNSFQFLRRG